MAPLPAAAGWASAEKIVSRRRLALVGQPNVGKSVLFQALTGRYVTVSNYPGTTVEITRGVGDLDGGPWQVTDTPGIRGLLPRSEDELAARNHLLEEPPDALVQVADAKDLRRALRLTLELSALDLPMVLVLNLSDEARACGFGVDAARLSRALGFPVVETVAVTGDGVADLEGALSKAAPYAGPEGAAPEIIRAISALTDLMPGDAPAGRFICETLLCGEPTLGRRLGSDWEAARTCARKLRESFARPPELVLLQSRRAVAEELAARASWRSCEPAPPGLERLGMVLLEPLPGAAAALGVLAALYGFVGVAGAQWAVEFLEETVFGAWLLPPVRRLLSTVLPPGWFLDLWVGEMGLVSMGLTYALAIVLPVVTAFFLFFSVLEDSGYLPRLSTLLDRLFRPLGLNGKAVFPMILGLGCGTMATLTTRVLDSRRERVLATILMALAIPCSAQLGVVMGLLGGLPPWAFAAWLTAILAAFFGVGWAAARLLPGARMPFWIEIPPLRVPRVENILRKVRVRVSWYAREAIPYFLAGTFVLFMLDRTGGLRVLETGLSPVVTGWLGLPREATFALVGGFLKRDYGAAGFFDLSRRGLLSPGQVVVSLVTLTLFIPCLAQFLVMVKERGARAAAATALAVTAFALAFGGATRAALAALGVGG